MPRPSRREHLLDIAINLFCEHGYHATGIDRILEEAEISKRTMYVHFRSKEELIYAALQKYDGIFRNNFMKEVEKHGKTPEQKLLAIFDVAEAWFASDKFFGCMFINAIGEYSEENSPIRQISRQFKQLMWGFVHALAQQAKFKHAEVLADEICLLLEGAIVTAQVARSPKAAATAKKAAEILMKNSPKVR